MNCWRVVNQRTGLTGHQIDKDILWYIYLLHCPNFFRLSFSIILKFISPHDTIIALNSANLIFISSGCMNECLFLSRQRKPQEHWFVDEGTPLWSLFHACVFLIQTLSGSKPLSISNESNHTNVELRFPILSILFHFSLSKKGTKTNWNFIRL